MLGFTHSRDYNNHSTILQVLSIYSNIINYAMFRFALRNLCVNCFSYDVDAIHFLYVARFSLYFGRFMSSPVARFAVYINHSKTI